MCGFMFDVARNDALAKARGEPTRGFHNIQPNYSNPEVMAAVANKKSGKSTNFHNTGAPNIWQQYADTNLSPQKESAPPPVLRNDISTGSSNLRITQRKDRTNKRNVTSGRRTSKAKRFSTRSK